MEEFFKFMTTRQLLQFVVAITFFHSFEYVLAVRIHGKRNVTLGSLLISKGYLLAMFCSLLEYFIEIYFFPELKQCCWLISNTGLAMVVLGEFIRKLAIVTAGRSFTHFIRTYKMEHHVLVTHGVYRYTRHPGYCGFFIWAVGTQIMLCNPLATLAFAFVLWRFFRRRIAYEDFFLSQFFGSEYEQYARKTFSGIPYIK